MQKEGNETEELKKEIESLKKDLAKLSNSFEKVVSKTVESKFETIKNTIDEKIPKEKLDDIKKGADKTVKTIKEKYEEYPVLGLFLALGIGYLIGKSNQK